MRPGLIIGEFAQVTHLSVRTPRRYHELALLEPAVVDPDSMPLREVREMLATADPDARASLVAAHLARLESELAWTRMAVTSLRQLLQPEPEWLDVELRVGAADAGGRYRGGRRSGLAPALVRRGHGRA
jgi:hypothetical protein